MTGQVHVKRIYDAPSAADGRRVLVDRLWPRGVRRDAAALDDWAKDIAPTPALRKWFDHDPARWTEFARRYREELERNGEAVDSLRAFIDEGEMTLLYAAHDTLHNHALVLRDYLMGKPVSYAE